MTILYVTDAFAVCGGIERVLADKMNYLTEQYGYEVVLITVNQGMHAIPFSLIPQIKHVDLDVRMHQQYQYSGIRRLLKRRQLASLLSKKMRSALWQANADVVVCAKLDFVGVLNKIRGSGPLVVESHTLCRADQIEYSGWLRKLHVRCFKHHVGKVDRVVALTNGDTKDWHGYNRNVCTIPNIVHLNTSGTFSMHDEKRVMFVGRYTKQKDINSLICIWEIVHQRHPDWILEIYSDGEIEAPGVQVFKPVANIMEQYRRNSMLLLTSVYEPFGLVLPEAMSCGLPVVSFDCPYGPADIITDGVDGFLIKNRDILAFADRVCQLIEDKELRLRMGQAAVKSAQRYRADVIMPKWKELFEHLCRKE